MDTYWFNKLINVLMVQTNSENEKLMVLYLDKELKKLKLPYHIDGAGNVIVTKGEAKTYPCVVSHMDTVHNFANNFVIYKDIDNPDLLFAMDNKRRVGIGGDDKCGVFVCLYLLKTMPQIKVVFFSREECGCKGSTSIDKGFFSDCRYLIQLDRKGSSDFIQTFWGDKTISHDFSSEIGIIKKKYKYKNQTGTVTDVMKLWKNKVGISCINLSCGYYKPHSNYEYVSVDDLWNSTKFTEEIINNMESKRYLSLPPPPTIIKSVVSNLYSLEYNQCYKCKQWKKDALLYTHWDNKTKRLEKFCYSCKFEKNNGIKTGKMKKVQSKLSDKGATIFACVECGIKTSEMKAGDSLKYIDGNEGRQLYCSGCASLFNTTKEETLKICYVCNKPIPKDQTPIEDKVLVGTMDEKWAYMCEDCNSFINNIPKTTPQKCVACDKIIPRDHKIVERYGELICEDCALPSDIVIADDGVNAKYFDETTKKKHIRKLERDN